MVSSTSDDSPVATMHTKDDEGETPTEQQAANAQLVGAAPEMLTALRRLSRYVLSRSCKECPFCESEHLGATEDDAGNIVPAEHRSFCELALLLSRIDGEP